MRYRSILIVKMSAMGDLLHALPALDLVRKAAPEASIDWAVESRFADLLVGHPFLRRVVPLDIKGWRGDGWLSASTRAAVSSSRRSLRDGAYDLAIDLQGNLKSGIVTLASGAPSRFGFDASEARERLNGLFTNRKVSTAGDVNIRTKLLRIAAAPFGATVDPDACAGLLPPDSARDKAMRAMVAGLLPEAGSILAIHTGTTWTTKRMAPSFYVNVVRRIRASGHPRLGVVLSWGTEAEKAESEGVASALGNDAALLPRLGFKDLASAYRACDAMLGPDTGPLHLAAAAGVPTVSVFRGTDPAYLAPVGPAHRHFLTAMACAACKIRGAKICPKDAECQATIPVAGVAEAILVAISRGDGA